MSSGAESRGGPETLDREGLSRWARGRLWRMLIGGRLVAASHGVEYDVVDPFTEEGLGSVPAADAATVDAAVAAAAAASVEWRHTSVGARARMLRAFARLISHHRDELAAIDAMDTGNPLAGARVDAGLAVELVELAADSGLAVTGITIPSTPDHLHFTVRQPYGVVARIVPYNHPLMFVASKVAAPLIAGNTVVVKVPDQAPLAPLRLAELAADTFPPGVLNVVSGHGAEAGDALVRHPAVRRIAFIGSVGTGRAVQRAAAESAVKHVTLELGGKNPIVVYPDADLAAAASGVVRGMNLHATGGQSCGSTSRLLVHASIADELVGAVAERMRPLRLGDPLDEGTQVGTMVSREQYEKVLRYIHSGLAEGARLHLGGGPPDGFARGFVIAPTLFVGVRPEMEIARDEIFGPVLSVMTWRTEEEALSIANATDYGLTASVWTSDLRAAHRFADRVEAGYVWINSTSVHYPGTPFGGVKDSGVGREEDLEEILSFTQTKTVNVPFG